MLLQQLTLSFECLSSIGNSLEIESMISEVLITFSRKTGAVSASYYQNITDTLPLVKIGKNIEFDIKNYAMFNEPYKVFKEKEKEILILLLKQGYILLIYKDKEESIDKLAAILSNFQDKINLSISACEGVQKLEQLNEKLEERVEESVKKIHENEKMLISQAKQATMGEMIEMIAHQWRQPITSIGMIANNILFDLVFDELDNDKLKEEVDKINGQVMYLSSTIDDFRDFFKESKEQEEVLMQSVLKGAMSIVDKQLKKHNIEVQIIDKAEEVHFKTFKNELIQVLLNILGNAKDAFEERAVEDRKITIGTTVENECIKLLISDNAGGINSDIISKVFDPYFSTKKQKNGTGLGLYMSMVIVTEHLHGSIKVENIDKGVVFTILLPIKGVNRE